jgi:hypothetical protein
MFRDLEHVEVKYMSSTEEEANGIKLLFYCCLF